MKEALVIGGGISGLCCAVKLAEAGVRVKIIAPYPSERSQSVMAAGGINGVLCRHDQGDSVDCHIEDTIKGGSYIAGREAVSGLCRHAEEIIEYLKKIGTVFTVDSEGAPLKRAFGGQSYKRTCFCGASSGKQIVSALVMEVRRFEVLGLIERQLWTFFHSALIRDGKCYGALIYNEKVGKIEAKYADAVVMATGGQNALFGKTTGSTQCDGYAAGQLFLQGVKLKNLEFIQYHPTTLETGQKRMLISEAVRGEGGRLFYIENSKRIYFMEEKYGPKGNLMTRDLVSREIDKVSRAGKEVFLDISFLGEKEIRRRIFEVSDLCMKYRGIDISKEPIPVAPSVHFFMGGLAVHLNHETNIRNLFAVGECASIYHGANRLGGNSLLAAMYSGMVAAKEIISRDFDEKKVDFSSEEAKENMVLQRMRDTKSQFPVMYIRDMLADTMSQNLGIVRNEESLKKGLTDLDYYLSICDRLSFDSSVSMYTNYSLKAILTLAKATLLCALHRNESRGAHFRSDYPDSNEAFAYATIIANDEGQFNIGMDKEHIYES
ncbi:MAG: FAD-binding protein [Lachnospiraceae bacterium]|nr:FAD-binding protein [Lachnospiraceae bacterium]